MRSSDALASRATTRSAFERVETRRAPPARDDDTTDAERVERARSKKQTAEDVAAQMEKRAAAQARLAAAQAAAAASAAAAKKKTDDGGHAISKDELQELLKEFAPGESFEPEVEEMLLEITDDFVDNVLEHAARLARHRGSEAVEPKDVLLHLERQGDMHIPGYGGEEVPKYTEKQSVEPHSRRLAAVRRSVAAATAAQNEQRKQARLAADRATKGKGDMGAEDA